MKKELADKLNKIVKKISANKKVMAIYLFGSQVTGRAREDSDIDIAVILKNPTEKDEGFVAHFWNGNFDVHCFHKLPLLIQFRVIHEGKLLFLRDREFLRYVWTRTVKKYLDFKPFIHRFYRKVLQNVQS